MTGGCAGAADTHENHYGRGVNTIYTMTTIALPPPHPPHGRKEPRAYTLARLSYNTRRETVLGAGNRGDVCRTRYLANKTTWRVRHPRELRGGEKIGMGRRRTERRDQRPRLASRSTPAWFRLSSTLSADTRLGRDTRTRHNPAGTLFGRLGRDTNGISSRLAISTRFPGYSAMASFIDACAELLL